MTHDTTDVRGEANFAYTEWYNANYEDNAVYFTEEYPHILTAFNDWFYVKQAPQLCILDDDLDDYVSANFGKWFKLFLLDAPSTSNDFDWYCQNLHESYLMGDVYDDQ